MTVSINDGRAVYVNDGKGGTTVSANSPRAVGCHTGLVEGVSALGDGFWPHLGQSGATQALWRG